jgi:hypothetical protein
MIHTAQDRDQCKHVDRKKAWSSLPAEPLLASQEGLCSADVIHDGSKEGAKAHR